MARTRKEHACPGCGEMGWHPPTELCWQCKQALQEHQHLQAVITERQQGTTLYVLARHPRHFTLIHAVPRHWLVSQTEDRVVQALGQLAQRLGEPTREQSPGYDPDDEKPLPASRGRYVYDYDNIRIRLPADVADLISEIESALQAYSKDVYNAGKVDGASLLDQLASGAITTDRFNDRTIVGSRAERNP